eukprot:2643518-Heterocapsa_arctica.AAC.1
MERAGFRAIDPFCVGLMALLLTVRLPSLTLRSSTVLRSDCLISSLRSSELVVLPEMLAFRATLSLGWVASFGARLARPDFASGTPPEVAAG